MERKHCNRYQQRLLLDEIANKHKHLKQLNKQLDYETNIFNNKVTWTKRFSVTYSINIMMNTYKNNMETTHEKKFNNLYMNKQKEGVKENPNNINWNLTTRVLSFQIVICVIYIKMVSWQRCLDLYLAHYENTMLLGGLNVSVKNLF